MLSGGTKVFFQRRDEFAERILHAGEVVRVGESKFIAEPEELLQLETGQDIHIYYEVEQKFVQQPVRIIAIGPAETGSAEERAPEQDPVLPKTDRTIEFETTGFGISAECRECYRVTTVMANLTAELGSETNCPLTDVSAVGFSVISTTRHELNAVLPATLIYEDKRYSGMACIQSIKELITGKTRYGLRHLADADRLSGLEAGQQRISAEVQRMQLKRRSGSH